MEKLTLEILRGFIDLEIDEFKLEDLRKKHSIASDCSVFYKSLDTLLKEKYIKRVSRATYRKVKKVYPVSVFGRERRPPIKIKFPVDHTTGKELFFVDDIVFREGDLILISGESNKGKTALCMNICGENIDEHPILMGNEYTIIGDEPNPRFVSRLDRMDWVDWENGDGEEKFVLLPVREDYEEHIVPDRLNIIDWINLDPDRSYLISPVLEGIKKELKRGMGVVAIQKAPGSAAGRGGQYTKDFTDVELLLDSFGENEIMLTIGKVKEPQGNRNVTGRKFAYRVKDGVRIVKFREIVKCTECWGKGWRKEGNNSKPCKKCDQTGYIDKDEDNHDVHFDKRVYEHDI